jgi:anti-sigma factor RsiW
MTAAERPISTDELHAYVDDGLDPARRIEVEDYLETHPAMARQVAVYRAQREALRSALASRAAAPIPPELNLGRLLEARLRRRPLWWRAAAIAFLCLGIGGVAGWYVGGSPSSDRLHVAMSLLQQQAMASHAVFAADGSHPIEVAAAEQEHLARWLSNRLQRNVVPPDLAGLGYRLLGGRLLATEHGGAAALFVYDNARGDRLSVLLRPMARELKAGRADIAQGALNGCSWIDGGMGYAVIAAVSDETLDRIADQVGRQIANAG